MKYETRKILSEFKPRSYQIPIVDAIENKGYKRVVAILPRRAGKDIIAWNLAIRQCVKKFCVVYYVFPTRIMAKKIILDSVTNEGKRFLDFIPKDLVESINNKEMKIRFTNGSLLQFIESKKVVSLLGNNPAACIFSEYALQDPKVHQLLGPLLKVFDGWALFISTPRGKNHLYELYKTALANQDWFVTKLSIDDTKHIPYSTIEEERAEGIMSEEQIQQEYFCIFDTQINKKPRRVGGICNEKDTKRI